MKQKIINIALCLFFLAGLSITLYPVFSDWYISRHQGQVVDNYDKKAAEMSQKEISKAHTGLPSAKMFDNITEVKEGDIFYIHVLNRILAYEVNQIKVVLPENISDLLINRNKDYVTLVTCTPYGINSHRLLVRGERVPYKEAKKKEKTKKKSNSMWKAYALVIVLAVVLIILLWKSSSKKKQRKKQVRRNEK